MKKMRIALCLLAGIAFASACLGQDDAAKRAETTGPQFRFYRLDYVVKEVENDKVVNSRAYTTLLKSDAAASIRAGTRVPYTTSTIGPDKQYGYYDLGVNIDSRDARELSSGNLMLNVNVDISSVVLAKDATSDLPPVVRTTKWSSPVIIPAKRATTIFSSDDPSGNRKMQLELTATLIQ